jgi:hypothetical protein
MPQPLAPKMEATAHLFQDRQRYRDIPRGNYAQGTSRASRNALPIQNGNGVVTGRVTGHYVTLAPNAAKQDVFGFAYPRDRKRQGGL